MNSPSLLDCEGGKSPLVNSCLAEVGEDRLRDTGEIAGISPKRRTNKPNVEKSRTWPRAQAKPDDWDIALHGDAPSEMRRAKPNATGPAVAVWKG